MRTKSKTAHAQLTRLGGPAVGTVTALGVAREAGGSVVFVGSRAGLFRTVIEPGESPSAWERLANAPVGILALAVSPAFAHDQRLVAGTLTGLYYSTDGGETWRPSAMPMSETTITTLACSPHFTAVRTCTAQRHRKCSACRRNKSMRISAVLPRRSTSA